MKIKEKTSLLNFTRKEKNGIVFLLFLIVLLFQLPRLFSLFSPEKTVDTKRLQQDLVWLEAQLFETAKEDSLGFLQNKKDIGHGFKNQISANVPLHLLTEFDPNTLSPEGWKNIGLQEKTIHTIQNYLSKGGQFRKKEDVKKIWGITDQQAAQLLPFIKIPQKFSVQSSFLPNKFVEKKSFTKTVIDLNLSDSSDLESLPGIGVKLAQRIIKYRNRLGGFYAVEQVGETFGLPDSTFQKIKYSFKITPFPLKKIDLNEATLNDLISHPYIRYLVAHAIIEYRNRHGKFLLIEDIKKILLIDAETFNKIVNYLVVS